MSSHSHKSRGQVAVMRLAMIAVLCGVGTFAAAQAPPPPKWEVYGGYSAFYPGCDIHGLLPGATTPVSSCLKWNPRGAGATLTYDFNRWFGLSVDSSGQWGSGATGVNARIDRVEFSNLSAGPKITFRSRHFSPFLEALVGEHRLASEVFGSDREIGFMAGGGLDLDFTRHFAWRLFRADYVFSNHQFGPSSVVPATDVRGARLQTGLVFMWGGKGIVTSPTAVCSVEPHEVFAGEPVTATAAGSNFNPKRTVGYSWSGSGLPTGATGASTQIDTTSLRSGSYQITASLSDGTKAGVATCSAGFIVKSASPPVISCSSNPTSVPVGTTSTISSSASSPDGRRLTYSYTTSAGNIASNAPTAVLDTQGAQPGTITVTCNVGDDRNPPLMASSTTTVTVLAPPPPPPPPPDIVAIEKRLALHSVYFATAKPSLENPDTGLLPSQEKTLKVLASDFQIYLQAKPDANLTLEGHADPRGSMEYNQALSERRVDRVKRFLVEQGVPAASIQTKAFGVQQNLTNAQVRQAVERNPELSPEDRQRVLNNLRTIILASNRRVDITLSNTGQASQESVREYPFNAADSLTLLQEEGTKKTARPAARKKAKRRAQ
jgi:outer membrane protein OmpA-like peptidoglycan-associated protein